MEIWKDIIGYEGIYQVSNLGRVRSLKRFITHKNGKTYCWKEKIRKSYVNKHTGYVQVELSNNQKKKKFYVHRLVAEAFLESYNSQLTVNHKDFNRKNNCVENLECVTLNENFYYSYRANRIKLPPEQKPKQIICLNDKKMFNSLEEAGKFYNIHPSSICNQLKGRINTTHNKKFAYALGKETI